jgi:tetratricopeptide (TPR) repeat protein
MRKFILIFALIALLSSGGCASQRELSKSKRATAREYNQRAAEYVIQGATYELQENHKSALIAYQEALLYDPTSASIYNAIAENFLRLGKQQSALEVLGRALHYEPNNLQTHELKSWSLILRI